MILDRKTTKIVNIGLAVLIVFSFLSIFNSLSNTNNRILNKISLEIEQRDCLIGDFLHLSTDDPNSRPLQITQHARVYKSYLPLNLPTNVSFTLVEGWTSKM